MSFSPPSGGKVAGRPDQRQVVAGRMRSKSSPRDEGPPLVLRGGKVLRGEWDEGRPRDEQLPQCPDRVDVG